MTNNYINFVAIEELFNLERESIQNDKSLDYPTKRMLVNELDRVWCYILQTPLRKIVSTDIKFVKRGKWVFVSNYRDFEGDICSSYSCNCCNYVVTQIYDKDDLTNYCPNCGVDMRGEDIDTK